MKKTRPHIEKKPPLPADKPASYGNESKGKNDSTTTGERNDKGRSKIKSEGDSPQKVREKLEHDTTKKEKDPGMTER